MNFKNLRADMTEQALVIESALRVNTRITLDELSELCHQNPVDTGFILEQMMVFNVVQKGTFGRYSLAPEYLKSMLER